MPRLVNADRVVEELEEWESWLDEHRNLDEISMLDLVAIANRIEGMQNAISCINKAETVDAIIIPPNATNGDVIKAIYPDNKFLIDTFWGMIDTSFTGKKYEHHLAFPVSWWNAPYKKGGQEDEIDRCR